MRDLPPMPPCTTTKLQHDLVAIPCEIGKGVAVTLNCCRCGAVRIYSVGEQRSGALDDLDSAQIERIVRKAKRP